MRASLALVALLVALLVACRSSSGTVDASPSPTQAAAPQSPASEEDRIAALLRAEQTRTAGGVTPQDQQSRDVVVRRGAARALARIGGGDARAGLVRALDDEDPEVVTWAAYGLGFSCRGHEKQTVSALVARGLSLPAEGADAGVLASPMAAIARAIGQCGAEESEPTLVAWLAGPAAWVLPAALGLGDLAGSKQKLREETLAALLNVAAGSAARPPVTEALFAPARLERVPLTVTDRLREVATARLGSAEDGRLFAVKALSRAGDESVPELARVLRTPAAFSPAERAEAARGLGKLGKHGQEALVAALQDLLPDGDPVAMTGHDGEPSRGSPNPSRLVSDGFGVTLTAVEQITDASVAKKPLTELAALPPPPSAPPSVLRRLSLLRCAAAKTVAATNFKDKALAACDVSGGGIGARAMVDVIGRDAIVGPRLVAYKERLHDADVRAREAAVELLEKHDEVEGAAAMLTEALTAKEGGVVATAAEVLAKQPARATETHVGARPPKKKGKKKVDLDAVTVTAQISPAVVKALLEALSSPAVDIDPEAATSLIDAAGALAVGDAKARLLELCGSPYPTTRDHAQKALALVGEKKSCDAPVGGGPPPAELDHLERSPVVIDLVTDGGALTLTLDPANAPVAVTRFADLVRAGFYNGRLVHRVVPGFVAQFGAPLDDGFGGPAGKPALRCETSPLPFTPLTVGVALAGRDTGASQLFVMLGRYPHLDGRYALVGTASGPWATLAEGDVITKATIRAR